MNTIVGQVRRTSRATVTNFSSSRNDDVENFPSFAYSRAPIAVDEGEGSFRWGSRARAIQDRAVAVADFADSVRFSPGSLSASLAYNWSRIGPQNRLSICLRYDRNKQKLWTSCAYS